MYYKEYDLNRFQAIWFGQRRLSVNSRSVKPGPTVHMFLQSSSKVSFELYTFKITFRNNFFSTNRAYKAKTYSFFILPEAIVQL